MDSSQKILDEVFLCGKLGKSIKQTAMILDVSEDEMSLEMEMPKSKIAYQYNRGKEIGNFEIEKALLSKAEKGDIKAIKELRARQYFSNIKEIKSDLFNI